MSSTFRTMVENKKEFKAQVDIQSSRQTYKNALKALVKDYTSEEFIEAMSHKYVDSKVSTIIKLDEFKAVFTGLEMETPSDFFNYPKPKGEGQDWSLYNAAQTVFRLMVREETLTMDPKTFKRDINTMLKVLIDTFAKTNKDNVILNELAPKIASLWNIEVDQAPIHLDVWCKTGIISYDVMVNQETGAREHMYKLNLDIEDLRTVYFNTSDRKVRFGEIKSVDGKDILIKRKYPYEFKLDNVEGTEGIDWINSTRMSLNITEDRILDVVKRKIFGNNVPESAKLTEKWHFRILEQATKHFNLIQDMGNVFQVNHKADGVFRLYDLEDFFSVQQGEFVRHFIEFADKEELTETGKKWIKLKIAAENGYSKSTEEVAMQAFIEHGYGWSRDPLNPAQHLFDILFSNKPTGYMLELDAQSQNYGIYGLLTGETSLTDMAGYHPTQRLDLRDIAAIMMNAELGTTIWSKDNLKSPIMTKAYSAGYKTLMFGSNYNEDNDEIVVKGRQSPLMHTSTSSKEDTWTAFMKTMNATVPRVLAVMEDIELKASRNTAEVPSWVMPDGIKCQIALQETVERELVWVDENGKMHKAKHHQRVMNAKSGVTAFAPRIIQSVDAYLLRLVAKMLKDLGIAFTAVHDGYIVHPNNGDILCECYRKASLQVFEENILSNIVNQLFGAKVNYQAKGNMTKEYIMNSHYALWL